MQTQFELDHNKKEKDKQNKLNINKEITIFK